MLLVTCGDAALITQHLVIWYMSRCSAAYTVWIEINHVGRDEGHVRLNKF
jgi:hypothetical protein